jgi:hypothetical protein
MAKPKLVTLMFGKGKKNMKPIMTDLRHKCENYQKGRESSGVQGYHSIIPAEEGAVIWKKNGGTGPWTNYDKPTQPGKS